MKEQTKKEEKVNNKKLHSKYKYMHLIDCLLYVSKCANCNKEIGGWTPSEADKAWEEHEC